MLLVPSSIAPDKLDQNLLDMFFLVKSCNSVSAKGKNADVETEKFLEQTAYKSFVLLKKPF